MTPTPEARAAAKPPAHPLPGSTAADPLAPSASSIAAHQQQPQLVGSAPGAGRALRRVLGPLDLFMVGIAVIIGAGVFVLTGTAARDFAGPAVVVSFAVAGVASAASALCYSELASEVATTGGAAVYAEAMFGPLAGWLVAVNLLFEYVLGSATVARGFTAYLSSLAGLSSGALLLPPGSSDFQIDLPAVGMAVAMAALVGWGVRQAAWANTAITTVVLLTVVLILAAGFAFVHASNYHPFAPYGVRGILKGASRVFFAFIGFDMLAVAAEEARKPSRQTHTHAAVHPATRTPLRATALATAATCLLAALAPLELLASLVSLGTLAAFTTVCAVVLWRRCSLPPPPSPPTPPLPYDGDAATGTAGVNAVDGDDPEAARRCCSRDSGGGGGDGSRSGDVSGGGGKKYDSGSWLLQPRADSPVAAKGGGGDSKAAAMGIESARALAPDGPPPQPAPAPSHGPALGPHPYPTAPPADTPPPYHGLPYGGPASPPPMLPAAAAAPLAQVRPLAVRCAFLAAILATGGATAGLYQGGAPLGAAGAALGAWAVVTAAAAVVLRPTWTPPGFRTPLWPLVPSFGMLLNCVLLGSLGARAWQVWGGAMVAALAWWGWQRRGWLEARAAAVRLL
ncbi:Cationic amino acid transporter 1 [Tetrabaena socialis]|uniref:Cationic amino acid transporter 1 n=1 Tax=Tetrabaena socialis TaxID=47790 RepID=A0A2J7ZV95_9CHLO|nr:Cationic amino acid transporter 1 [Tetrabaena socialis]|eukprot:PNH04180.1 Cationic amino acid transporter 1 [Tetrabaena socialis]